jgi:hypothetical protein
LPISAYPGATQQTLRGCIVRGPGVEQPATAGQRSYLIVAKPKGFDDDDERFELDEEGQAAWESAEYAYATFENEDGAFGAWSKRLNGTIDEEFHIEFWPPRSGTFRLTVDLLSKKATWPIHDRRDATIEVLAPEDGKD